MPIVKLNANKYSSAMHGRGINGKYFKVRTQNGYGIVDSLGKDASKYVLGGIGKSTGGYYGKMLGKLIGDKTGSKLLGQVAKASLGSLGGLAGNSAGQFVGKHLGNTVFGNNESKKKEKKTEEKVSLSQLLDNARKSITGSGINIPSGHGINIPRGNGIMLNY